MRHEMNRIFNFSACFSHVVDQVRLDLHNGVIFPVYVFARHNMLTARRSQSINIGKFDLIDIDCIDQSVEIDDTLICFIDFS